MGSCPDRVPALGWKEVVCAYISVGRARASYGYENK